MRIRGLIAPDNLFEKTLLFDFSKLPREQARLIANPPVCGSHIRYREPSYAGEFWFACDELVDAISRRIAKSPHLHSGQEGILLNLISTRDDSLLTSTEIPWA